MIIIKIMQRVKGYLKTRISGYQMIRISGQKYLADSPVSSVLIKTLAPLHSLQTSLRP